MKQKIGTLKRESGNFYRDEHNTLVLFLNRKKVGYIIPKERYRIALFSDNRYVLAGVAGILLGSYVNVYVGIVSAVVLAIGMEIYTQKKVYPLFDKIDEKDFPQVAGFKETMKNGSSESHVFRLALSVVFIILLVVNLVLYGDNYVGINKILIYLLTIGGGGFACYLSYLSIICLKENKKNK